ncbi:hypothetical protein [Bacillus pinisoli]|uniref:hypothetical protein n=1 Tax=Bacillus pinisoli TaxID=2901866 RepID=UPI001FF2B98B|nr:hypothetical protein [Bacillus pinisoli]
MLFGFKSYSSKGEEFSIDDVVSILIEETGITSILTIFVLFVTITLVVVFTLKTVSSTRILGILGAFIFFFTFIFSVFPLIKDHKETMELIELKENVRKVIAKEKPTIYSVVQTSFISKSLQSDGLFWFDELSQTDSCVAGVVLQLIDQDDNTFFVTGPVELEKNEGDLHLLEAYTIQEKEKLELYQGKLLVSESIYLENDCE